MVINQLRYLLTDNESLEQYYSGQHVSLDDIKRRIFLKAREQKRSIPDHYYRLAQEKTFKQVDSLSTLFSTNLQSLAEEYLEMDGNKIFVRSLKQNDWQELITFIPPLLLQSALIAGIHRPDFKQGDRAALLVKYVLPNIRHTAIPSPRIRQLDFLAGQENGLHDLHIHLNGTLEVDEVWQDYLENPLPMHTHLQEATQNAQTKEQLEQESTLLVPDKFLKLLIAARNIRFYFWNHLFGGREAQTLVRPGWNLLEALLSDDYSAPPGHPFASLISDDDDRVPKMPVEAMMYILLLNELRENNNEQIASLFHFYLLILGLVNRLLVQQTHQKGFQQFQKHTVNGLRWQSEMTYFRRYFQLNGNEQRFIRFLEGRFAPKDQEAETIQLVDAIYAGWKLLLEQRKEVGLYHMPELKLIAHFIKQRDNGADRSVRHSDLRKNIWKKGTALASLTKSYDWYKDILVGIDAAASEFDTPPEVFGPVFRFMRRSNFRHFTFHAGEDFYHIVTGLRAIYEAIKFCDLRNGDRVGHATASGLPVEFWKKQIGHTLLMRKIDVLDDLVFTYHMIASQQVEGINHILPSLIHETTKLGYEIFERMVPVTIWEKAWLLRQCCPIHALKAQRADVPYEFFDEDEWIFVNEMVSSTGYIVRFDQEGLATLDEIDLLTRYHTAKYQEKGSEVVEVDPFAILSVEVITQLQLGLLRYMNSNEIVIETLPTSNVRIGIHQDFRSYHLHNWVHWRQEGRSVPPIIVGSDDAGIFATNIYNEYANIYCSMLAQGKPLDMVMNVIKKLAEDARIYRFYGA